MCLYIHVHICIYIYDYVIQTCFVTIIGVVRVVADDPYHFIVVIDVDVTIIPIIQVQTSTM